VFYRIGRLPGLFAPANLGKELGGINVEPAATAFTAPVETAAVAVGSGLTPQATSAAPWRPVNWASTPSGFGFSDCRVVNDRCGYGAAVLWTLQFDPRIFPVQVWLRSGVVHDGMTVLLALQAIAS